MAARTYSKRVLVLRKVKLGESDLILTLLAEDGGQLRAVAKGARKPTSSFASRLELFSCADVLFVHGKSLDIVKEAKLVSPHDSVRIDMMASSCASVVSELLMKSTDVGLENPRLFMMANAFFDALGDVGEDDAFCACLCLACLIKIIAQLGFRPCIDACVECGMSLDACLSGEMVRFSHVAGGVVCEECAAGVDCVRVNLASISWLEALVRIRFVDIAEYRIDGVTLHECFVLVGTWIRVQLGINLRSLEMLLGFLRTPSSSGRMGKAIANRLALPACADAKGEGCGKLVGQ